MSTIPKPEGFATLNPFFLVDDADGLIAFLRELLGGEEHPDARTVDVDGLLLHAELEIDGVTLMFGERKPDWPHLPQLTQVYVADVEATIAKAEALGAEIITRPTPFFGTSFSRILDPWGNLWWVYEHGEPDAGEWGEDAEAWAADDDAQEWSDPGLAAIHESLLEVVPRLARDPRADR